MNKTICIPEGYTYDYVVHGFVLWIIGGVLATVHPLFFFLFFVAGIVLMVSKSGVEIDPEKHQIRKYATLFFQRRGKWISLDKYIFARLDQNDNTVKIFQYNLAMPMVTGRRINSRTHTFDIILLDETGKEMIFNQFFNYAAAKKVLAEIRKAGIQARDIFGERLKFQLKNRLPR